MTIKMNDSLLVFGENWSNVTTRQVVSKSNQFLRYETEESFLTLVLLKMMFK